MNIALFGGAFDPVHSGHLAAAQAAQQAFRLDQVLFVPARLPPHKRGRPLTSLLHRYAMVALACGGSPAFIPSLLEAGPEGSTEPNYSIVTVRKLTEQLRGQDRLFFLIGADAFLYIREWREPVALLDSCDFIIVNRPGSSLAKIAEALPEGLRAGPETDEAQPVIPLRRTFLHLLTSVASDISSSAIRQLARQKESLAGLVPSAVEDYIHKVGLYCE